MDRKELDERAKESKSCTGSTWTRPTMAMASTSVMPVTDRRGWQAGGER